MQAGFDGRPGLGQFKHLGVRVVEFQFGLAGAEPQQADIGRQQARTDHPDGGVTHDRLDPANAPVDRTRQHDETRHREAKRQEARTRRAEMAPWQSDHVVFQGLDVDDVEQGNVGNDGRQKSVLHDLDVGNAHVLHHQESRRAHYRRHQLAIDRARHLDRRRLVRAVADALHERNGEGAGGHHIGNG